MTSIIGQELGHYHILEQIGTGGMAIVYKAFDTRLEREVAIKIIRRGAFPPDHLERILKRFEREAKALAKLSHPNIVKILEYGEHENMPYLVMEYLPGGTIKQRLNAAMPWREAMELLLLVAQALEYAHEHNVIHRDIKPSNILLTEKGQPMLTDFGIAKMLETEETATLTGTGVGLGTPEYMAPEQGRGQTDVRSDIYSLGVVLYELVAGRKPFVADTPLAVVLMHTSDPLPSPRQFNTKLPVEVERVIIKAMDKKPENRYQSMGDFARVMRNLILVQDKEKKKQEEQKKIEDLQRQKREEQQKLRELQNMQRSEARNKRPLQKTIPSRLLIAGMAVLLIVSVAGWFGFSRNLINSNQSAATAGAMLDSLSSTSALPTVTSTPAIIAITPTAVYTIGSTYQRALDGMVMLYVPEGNFLMGSADSDPQADFDEKPQHTVSLDAFWIDQTEITNAKYASCVQAGICTRLPDTAPDTDPFNDQRYYNSPQFSQYPVINITWNDSQSYCNWVGGRLPTEAEWEKAARGTDGRTFPWGEGNDCGNANYYFCNPKVFTDIVASFESGKSPYGAYDMAGNVHEWVSDWYSDNYYEGTPQSNPQGASSGEYRVYKGGGWNKYSASSRVANRDQDSPDSRNPVLGFRCAVSASDLNGNSSATTNSPFSTISITQPTDISTATSSANVNCIDKTDFIADETIPDGTSMNPGQEFVKIWKIKNSGTCNWGDGYGLIYTYGEKFSGNSQPLGVVIEPGQEIDVAVNFKAPDKTGEYMSAWQMANANDIPFGSIISISGGKGIGPAQVEFNG